MKVGIVGLGKMGRHHAGVIGKFEFVDQIVGCDLNPAAREAARHEGLCSVVPDLDALLAAGPEAVFVVTQPSAHAAAIRTCLEAGRPVFTEKPLCTDLEEGRALVALAEARNLNLQVGFELRYGGMTQGMKDVVAQGQIGEPLHMHLIQVSGSKAKPDWMVRSRIGGIFYEKLCHQIDLFRFWFGEPERVMAVTSPNALAHYEAPDHVQAALCFPGGHLGAICFITTRAAHVGGTSDHGDRGHYYQLILTCRNGSVTFDHWTETLEVVRFNHREDLKSELIESINVRERYGEPAYALENQDRDFLEKTRQGKPPTFPASDALKSMEWVECAEQSLRQGGQWVEPGGRGQESG